MKWFAHVMMWLCTTIAVIVGMEITGHAECLCALILPAFIMGMHIVAEF